MKERCIVFCSAFDRKLRRWFVYRVVGGALGPPVSGPFTRRGECLSAELALRAGLKSKP